MKVIVTGDTLPVLSLTVTVPVLGSVVSLAAKRNSSLPLWSAFVLTKVIQSCAAPSTSTVKSVLYCTSTSNVPPSAGMIAVSPTLMTFFSSCVKVIVTGDTFPVLSLTVTVPVRGSVVSLAAKRNSSLPLCNALVPLNVIQDLAEASTSTVKSVLYWMSTE